MVTDTLYEGYIDGKYKAFSSKLSKTDTLPRVGIRIPALRALSKTLSPDDIEITYHEDVILKGLSIGYEKTEPEEKLKKLHALLPALSSWDQTDTIVTAFRPRNGEKEQFYSFFSSLLESREVYPKRLGIVWMMSNRKSYDREEVIEAIIKADDSEEYYISMAAAWALATFISDDRAFLPYLDKVSSKTKKRAEQKLRDSYIFNPRP